MADRRMFHAAVIHSDAFMDLPPQTQALYFHLGMDADDDGFVNGPRQVARTLGLGSEQVKELVDSGFLLDFDGVMVITHWLIANSLKNDRLKYPRFPEIARRLYIKDDRSYALGEAPGWENLLEHRIRTLESKRNPKVREGKVSKNRIKENKIEEYKAADAAIDPSGAATAAAIDSELKFMNGKLGKGVVLLTQEQMEELLEKMGLDSFDYYVEKLATFIQNNDAKVKNHYATLLKWWEEDRRII